MIGTLFLLLILLATLLHFYLKHVYSYWSRRDITQPTTLPLVGNILDFILKKKSIGLVYDEIYRKHHGHDVVGFYEFHIPKLMVLNPTLIQKILVSDFSSFRDNWLTAPKELMPHLDTHAFLQNGDKWKPGRATISYGLTTNKVRDMYLLMKESVPLLEEYLNDHVGQELDAKELGSLFMMTNVSNCVFGIESNCFIDHDAPFKKMEELFSKEVWQGWWQILVLFFLPTIRDFLGYRLVPEKFTNFVADLAQQVSNAKIKSELKRNDYFQFYLSRDKPAEENINDVISIAISFFISGMETSSVPAGNTLYELALNPEVQENLYKEVEEAFEGKTLLDYEDLVGLSYLDGVVHESLRKYPTLYAMAKECTKDITLDIDGKTRLIEAGTHLIVPVYSIHRDPLHYPDPEVFDPERFSKDNVLTRNPCTFLSFGDGPRICPGQLFGLAQLKLFLAHIVHKYKIVTTENTPSKLEFSPTAYFVDYTSKHWIRLEKRNANL